LREGEACDSIVSPADGRYYINFELVGEMEDLADNLHNATEIINPKGFSCGRKDVGVKEDEIEGPVARPNVENSEALDLSTKFTSIPITHNIEVVNSVR